jgi:hypothetical protein
MTRLSREEIYHLVWQLPMTAIAKKYLISDVGFRKLCKRMNIPIPQAGYWTKIKAGHRVAIPPLPKNYKGRDVAELTERPAGKPSRKISELDQLVKAISLEKLPFKVPDRFTRPDRLTLAAKETLAKLRDNRFPGMALTKKGQLDIRVSPANIGRALRFMDTLIKCVRARGHRYEVDNDRNYIALRDIKLTVKFRERTIKVKVSDKPYREYEWHPNGKLIFRMEGRLVSEWGDLKTRLLEEQLPNILAKLELTAKNEEQYIENARLWRERWEMQRKLEAEREAHHKQELIDFKALLAKAERWKRANVLREYLSAIGSPDVTWLTWAQSKIDWFDPLTEADDEWLKPADRDIV